MMSTHITVSHILGIRFFKLVSYTMNCISAAKMGLMQAKRKVENAKSVEEL